LLRRGEETGLAPVTQLSRAQTGDSADLTGGKPLIQAKNLSEP